ncbi:hypothetical protein F4811DRAFT_555393 [Daldinia bambusicola]|nr:hypothetical protein F4811DRAFT_555393 [Daldinia bambusicola]
MFKTRPRSPRIRAQKYSVFGELSREAIKTYSPGEFLTIVHQRENVRKVAQAASRPRTIAPGFLSLNLSEPWVPNAAQQCRFLCCQRCRPLYEEKSFLSLDGIVKGDIPATAAVGFGFHRHACRPIVHPDEVRNIGLRAVPWPLAYNRGSSSKGSGQDALKRSWKNLTIANGQEDEIKHDEHAEHVAHVEHVEDVEHVESVGSQFLRDSLTVKYADSDKPTKSSTKTKGNIQRGETIFFNPSPQSLGFTVSLKRKIPLLPAIEEEGAFPQEPDPDAMEEDTEGPSETD